MKTFLNQLNSPTTDILNWKGEGFHREASEKMLKDELIKEVEDKMDSGETFTMKEIKDIMRRTGLSYRQVVGNTKKLDKEIKRAQKAAEEKGEPFDKDAYIRARMRA